jgi:hypothetical protein
MFSFCQDDETSPTKFIAKIRRVAPHSFVPGADSSPAGGGGGAGAEVQGAAGTEQTAAEEVGAMAGVGEGTKHPPSAPWLNENHRSAALLNDMGILNLRAHRHAI